MRTPIRVGIHRALRAAVTAALVASVTPLSVADAQTALVERIGTMEAIHEDQALDGGLILSPKWRKGWQVRQRNDSFRTELHEFDLDTLEPVGVIELPRMISSVVDSQAAVHAEVDEERGRVFLPYMKGPGDQGMAGILVLDIATGDVTDQPLSPALVAGGLKIGGMSYFQPENRIYFLLRNNTPPDLEYLVNGTALEGSGTHRIFVMTWDPETGSDDTIRIVRGCRALFPNEEATAHYELPVMRSRFEASLWIGCANAQNTFVVVRVATDQMADQAGTEEVYPGPERGFDALADPGSDRILVRYSAALGESWWVFDGLRRSWVGVIGASQRKDQDEYGAGLDPTVGRLYLHYPDVGLMLADMRATPVPQALVFPEFEKGPSEMPIVVDPPTRRFFVRATDDRYDIYRDVPPAEPPPPPDPDRNTTDVTEQEGVTDVNFTAIGQGYGVRTLLIGGAFGITPPGPGSSDSRPLRALLNRTGTQCGPRDREIVLGLVEKTELSNSVAAVRAEAVRTDEATNQDLQSPSRCDLHPDAGLSVGEGAYPGLPRDTADEIDRFAQENIDWANVFAAEECSGDQKPSNETSREPFGSMTASVTCQQSQSKAEARAGGPALETDFATIGTALSRTKLFRDPRLGIVSQVYSVARGISIAGGLVEIDAVEAWAEASANGRAKNDARDDTATTRFVRRVTGITVRDATGRTVFTCEHCSRDILTAQQQINTAIAGRGEVRLPMPDPVLLAGTPGGYQAAVQKDRFQQIADNSLNNDPSREVPGLEIISINDSPELRARQVIQLAGVASGASYGIFLLDNFDFSNIPSFPDAVALPVGSELISVPDSGTVVSEALTSAPPALDPPSLNDRARNLVAQIPAAASYLIQNPVEGLLAASVWLLIGLPLYAFLRRRSLVKTLDSGVEQ